MPTLMDLNEAPKFPHEVQSQEDIKIENELLQKKKIQFAACMNETQVENLGKYPLYSLLKDISYPLTGSKLNFEELPAFLSDNGANMLLQPYVSKDPDDPTQYIITIYQGNQLLHAPYMYKDNTTRTLYLEAFENLLLEMHGPNYVPFERILKQHAKGDGTKQEDAIHSDRIQDDESLKSNQTGANNDSNPTWNWKSIVQGILDFETELAEIKEKPNLGTFHTIKVPRADLDQTYPKLGLQKMISMLLEQYQVKSNPQFINIYCPDYLKSLTKVIEKVSPEILNYWTWLFSLKYNLGYVNFGTRKILFPLKAHVFGKSVEEIEGPRIERCVQNVLGNHLGGRWYVATKFSSLARTRVLDIVNRFKSSFKMRLNELTWLDQPTREVALKKLDSLKALVGYPEISANMTALAKPYKNYTVTENDFFGNDHPAGNVANVRMWKKLDEPVNNMESASKPNVANAWYRQMENEIVRIDFLKNCDVQYRGVLLSRKPRERKYPKGPIVSTDMLAWVYFELIYSFNLFCSILHFVQFLGVACRNASASIFPCRISRSY
jgi:predicted metalloendopeptidase